MVKQCEINVSLCLCRVASVSSDNKMNVSNLATTFGPVLFNSENVSLFL